MLLCLPLMNSQKDIEMKALKHLMMVLLTVGMVGCASKPKTITEKKIIKVKVNPVYLETCAVTPLFSKEVYLNSTEAEREELEEEIKELEEEIIDDIEDLQSVETKLGAIDIINQPETNVVSEAPKKLKVFNNSTHRWDEVDE